MTFDELRIEIRTICEETARYDSERPDYTSEVIKWYGPPDDKRKLAREKISTLFTNYREQIFQLAEPPPWWEIEKNLKTHEPAAYEFMRRRAIAFFTCSCGSREDSCPEDGDGNFSTFVFMPEGDIFRIVEKKA